MSSLLHNEEEKALKERLKGHCDDLNETLDKAKRETVFEYAITRASMINRDKDLTKFEAKKESCPNCKSLVLFHEIDVEFAKSIVGWFFTRRKFEYGIGMYLSDSLDCARVYNPGFNKRSVPSVGDTFNFIVALVYYDGSKCVHITDDTLAECVMTKPRKNTQTRL